MQEQNESKGPSLAARIGLWNLIWIGIFSALLLTAALTWLWPCRSLPTATWREANSELPWKKEGICVKDVTAHWESSAGNSRMALRAAFFPVAEIELAESDASGMLYITFTDSNDRKVGDSISLSCSKGSFPPRTEVNITAEGNKARVFVEAGYDSASDFELHQVDENSQLWRVNLLFRPEGSANISPLGFVTIPAKLQQ